MGNMSTIHKVREQLISHRDTSPADNQKSTIKTGHNREMRQWWLVGLCLSARRMNVTNQVQRAEDAACWTATSRVSFLWFTALTSLIWVTWGNGLMAVSWVCFNTVGGWSDADLQGGTVMFSWPTVNGTTNTLHYCWVLLCIHKMVLNGFICTGGNAHDFPWIIFA